MQHFVPAVVLEVHVDIRHFLPFQIQEPLKDQLVFQGIHVGDAQAVERHAGCRASPHAEHYLVAMDKVADVPDHQEVVAELGMSNYFQLVLQPLFSLGRGTGVAPPETLPAQLGQVFVGRHVVGGGVLGQVGLAESQLHVAHIGDELGVAQRFRII